MVSRFTLSQHNIQYNVCCLILQKPLCLLAFAATVYVLLLRLCNLGSGGGGGVVCGDEFSFFHTVSSVSSTLSPLSGINKREAEGCHSIQHMANSFVVETVICDQWAPPQTPTRRLQSPLRSSVASYCSPDLPVANFFSPTSGSEPPPPVKLRLWYFDAIRSSPGSLAGLVFSPCSKAL